MPTVLFYRDFHGFSGGHLKVWHYFNHVLSAPDHQALVRFSPKSVWGEENPWRDCSERVVTSDATPEHDIVFLGGVDWLNLSWRRRRWGRRPVINLVQHVKHAEPDDVRYRFLRHRAVRICVSEQVAHAIRATGRVNGPVLTIPNALDLNGFGSGDPAVGRDIDVLIVAPKNPGLGRQLEQRLRRPGRSLQFVGAMMPRTAFLTHLARARVTVFVPARTEGFYLPALEGMALGTIVVCPDCVGNRSFCLHGVNCFRPDFTEDRLVDDTERALTITPPRADEMAREARATAARHDLAGERAAFHEVLNDLERLWTRS